MLLKISLIVSIVGIVFLSLFASQLEVTESTISKIDGNTQDTKIKGEVVKVDAREKITTIRIRHDEFMDVLIFDNISDISKGDKIIVTGEVKQEGDEYKIYADLIEKND